MVGLPARQVGAPAVAIEARGWGWRHRARKAWAVRGLDLRIEAGERVLLLGASGAGKSTVLAAMAGLLEPASATATGAGDAEGELLLNGRAARSARFAALEAGQALTGLLLQDPSAQTVMARCGDDVAFGLENYGVPREQIGPRVAASLAAVGLPYPPQHSTAQLSGGERQRLALAGVLALRPGLLLLDEPTAQLDPDGALSLRDHVAQVLASSASTCVLVEHRIDLWAPVIDRVVILAPGGGVQADGPIDTVLSRHRHALTDAGIWVPGWRPPQLSAGTPCADGARSTTASPRTPPEVVLKARDLAVARMDGGPDVVRDVDLDVRAGRALCLIGPNGSGKSSLALALGGLLAPSRGSLLAAAVLDPPKHPEPHRWRARQLLPRIGSVFQQPAVQFVRNTCAEELALGPQLIGLPAAQTQQRVGELLERLRLSSLARANPFTLSGGEQRRLSVATALATRPRALILDEPTFGQDVQTWTEVIALLGELRSQGTAIVAATHDPLVVEALADEVITVLGGRVFATPSSVARSVSADQ